MRGISIISDAVISPLGKSSSENFSALIEGKSGLSQIDDSSLSEMELVAGRINSLQTMDGFTRFENISIQSIQGALKNLNQEIDFDKTVFILATTKGNIELIEASRDAELQLHATAKKIATYFGIENSYVVSTACISGVMALITAKRLLRGSKFDHAIVTGCDVLSPFVVSGFKSLHALSDEACKPFDAQRKGLNLGEASATVIMCKTLKGDFVLSGDGATNDANHISGPSRTGDELAKAIEFALKESCLSASEIDFVSAHGTATLYNDEMESKAFTKANLGTRPVNSLKGYFGHTLGAAGLLEVIMSMHSLKNNTLIATRGFSALGVSSPLHVLSKNEKKPLRNFLKTASGFGGCNAAVVIEKRI